MIYFLFSKEYGYFHLLQALKGISYSLKILREQQGAIDFLSKPLNLKIPFYIFQGVKDYVCVKELNEELLSIIKAPKKEMILFHKSRHSPMFEEPTIFEEELLKIAQNCISEE